MLIPTFLCPKAWEGMTGTQATRFCSYCKKHVHNLESMSVNERLALLATPAASICSRYKVAIRRPAKGQRESYMRHMLKYSAGVALTGSVLLVLWEMHEAENKRTYYRAVAATPRTDSHGIRCGWPPELYEERKVVILGVMVPFPAPVRDGELAADGPIADPEHVDLKLDPIEVDKLLHQIEPPAFAPPRAVPVNIK